MPIFLCVVIAILILARALLEEGLPDQIRRICRFTLGVLLSPLVGLAVGSFLFLLNHIEGVGWIDGQVYHPVGVSFTYVACLSPMAYFGAVVLGVPFILIVRRLRLTSGWLRIFAGCAIGLITPLVLTCLFSPESDIHLRLFPHGILQPVTCGGVAMFVFWVTAEWERPNRRRAKATE